MRPASFRLFSALPSRSFRAWLASEGGFNAKLMLSSIAGAAVILLLVAVFFAVTYRERATERSRESILEVLRVAQKAEIELANLESVHRDAQIAGPALLREQVARRCDALGRRLDELTVLVALHPAMVENLAEVRDQLDRWEIALTQLPGAELPNGDSLTPEEHGDAAASLKTLRHGLARFSRVYADLLDQTDERAARERLWQTGGFAMLSLAALGFLAGTSGYSYRAFKRHVEKIESARAQTRLIIDTTLDGVLTTDAAGTVLLANPAAERLFGRPAAELVGTNISRLLPHRAFAEPLSQMVGATVTADRRSADAPLESFPVEISISNMEVDGAQQHVAVIRDLTDRRRNEEALRHIGLGVSAATGEAFVTSFVTALSNALEIDGAFLVELEPNDPSGTPQMTVARKGTVCRTGPCDLTATACQRVLEAGFCAHPAGARTNYPKDWLLEEFAAESFVGMPLLDANGTFTGLIGVMDSRPMQHVEVVESTLRIFAARAAAELDRKRYERDLAAEKERLAVTLRSIGDGCVTIDNNDRILLMNPVAERLTGWSQEQVVGLPIGEVFTLLNERTRRPCPRAIRQIINTGSATGIVGATVIVARDGTERLIETNANPICEASGRKIGVVLVFRDVTERHRVVGERQKAEKLESLGVAAGGIAHDFNNLLTAILGNLSLALFNPKLDATSKERLICAKKAGLRAQELAQQLLTFAKGGAPIKQTASIGQLVRDTVGFSLRGSNVRSEFTIADDLWAADVDAGQISQVIQNLAINGDQAMPAGGTLRIGCANVELRNENARLGLPPGRYLKITVQDEGIGIPEEHVKKIFDPYFTTKPKGSGLGLATSYSIIKNHGGLIEVVSQPGAGTCFYIFLPASDKPVAIADNADLTPVAHRAARVLVLDDEVEICSLVACALEPLGYEVVESFTALSAIQKYQQAIREGRRFDVVISDLTIPGGMGGEEAVRRLHEIDPDVKAIVSSGYAMDPVMSEFRAHGFCAMIAKPYEIASLGRVVAEVLAGPGMNVLEHDFTAEERAVSALG